MTTDEAAKALSVSPVEVETLALKYGEALDRLAIGRPTQRNRIGLFAVVAAVGALTFVGREALAQAACSPALPTGLTTFCADTPAIASELNSNLLQMMTWVQQKVGTVGTANISTAGSVTATGAISTANNLSVTGTSSFTGNSNFTANANFGTTMRQMLNLWNAEYGFGIQSSTIYARTGGGFAWYRGGAHSDATLNPGGGATLMTLGSSGALAAADRIQAPTISITGNKRTVTASDPAGWQGYGAGYNESWADCGNNPVTAVRVRQSSVSDQMIIETQCSN